MTLALNHVTLAGRLTRDPELKAVQDRSVCTFSLALNRRWKDQATGDTREEVTFVDCEAWARTGELIGQYLRKGSTCYIEGRLKLDRWKDEQGHDRSRMKVVVAAMQFLDPRREAADEAAGELAPVAPAAAPAPSARPSRSARPQPVGGDEPPF